jgi:hypothetical protein
MMAIKQKYPRQFAFVGTDTQATLLRQEAERTDRSMADIVRDAVDARYGLVDGERRQEGGQSEE